METDQTEEGNQPFVAHVPVPSQKEVSTLAWIFFLWFFFNLWLSFVCRRLRQSVVFCKFSSLAISRLLQSFIFRNALSWSSFDFNSFFHFFVQFNKVLFCSYRLRKCSFKERKWYGFDALNLKTAIILFSNFNLRVTFSILHYQRYHFYFRNFSKNTPARLLYNKAKKQKLYSVFNTMRIHLFTISNSKPKESPTKVTAINNRSSDI